MTTRPKPELERSLHESLQVFDLGEAATKLRAERTNSGRNAITLRKAQDLQVVLLAMQAGNRLDDHRAAGRITLLVLSGKVRFATEEESVELAPQMVVALDGGITHRVEALEESVCVLTIGSRPTTGTSQ